MVNKQIDELSASDNYSKDKWNIVQSLGTKLKLHQQFRALKVEIKSFEDQNES